MHGAVQLTAELQRQIDAIRGAVGGLPIRHVWCFDDTQRGDDAPFPNKAVVEAPNGVFYLAPFADGRLVYWDPEGRVLPGARDVHLMLDSNMLVFLTRVLLEGSEDPRYIAIIINLLIHYRAWRANVQPLPCLRELALRTRILDTERNAVRYIEAVLRFQGLDVEASVACEYPIPNNQYPDRMKADFGADDYATAAHLIFEGMAEKGHGFAGDMVSTYTLLLHVIDTSIKQRNASIAKKLAAADDFIRDVLVNAQPPLHVLVRYFYTRVFDDMLKIQPAKADFSRRGLRGAVYDLNLAALHQQFFGASTPPRADTSVICTADAPLARYAGRFLVRTLAVVENTYRMLLEWDDVAIKRDIGEELWKDASEAAGNRDVTKMQEAGVSGEIVVAMRELEDSLNITPEDRLVPLGQEGRIAWVVTLS
jgi:hypothetical protein